MRRLVVNLCIELNYFFFSLQSNYQVPPPPRPVHIKPNNNAAVNEVSESLVKNQNQEINFKSIANNNNNIVKDPYGTMRAEKKLATPPGKNCCEVLKVFRV